MVLNHIDRGQARPLVDVRRIVNFEEGAGVARFVEKEILEAVHVLVGSARDGEKEEGEPDSDDAAELAGDHPGDYKRIRPRPAFDRCS